MIFAIGVGVAVYFSQIYGEQTITQPAPEIVAYGYFPIQKKISLRPALRFNYSWQQAENPRAIQIRETDFRYLGELGVVYNWVVIPSLTVGIGGDYRQTHLKSKPPIHVSTDHVSQSENFLIGYFQAGVGFPLVRGFIVIEPYVRYTIMQNDITTGLGYGIEATIEIL